MIDLSLSQSTVNNDSPEQSKTMSRVTVCEQPKAEMKESYDRETHGKRWISDLSTPSHIRVHAMYTPF